LAAAGAAALWYSLYRLPARKERGSYSFWFVAGGYAFIALTLLLGQTRPG